MAHLEGRGAEKVGCSLDFLSIDKNVPKIARILLSGLAALSTSGWCLCYRQCLLA